MDIILIALILAAGTGSRLMPLTRDKPKPLLEIGGVTLLERMVLNCLNQNVDEFLLVTGHQKEKVEKEIDALVDKYHVKIRTVENKEFSTTNTSCSVYLGTLNQDDDLIIINGDNVMDEKIISGLLKTPRTALVVDNTKKLNHESFKIKIQNHKIEEIGKQIDTESASGEFIGISKISREDLPLFRSILKNLIAEDPQNYYDTAYQQLSQEDNINYFYTNGLKWTEIDDHTDWQYAQKLVKELEDNKKC